MSYNRAVRKLEFERGNPLKKNCIDDRQIKRQEAICAVVKKFKESKDSSCYLPIITYFKKGPLNNGDFLVWLSQLHSNIYNFNKGAEIIILDTLNILWEFANEEIIILVHNLTESLVTNGNESVKPVLECLFKKLKPDVSNENSEALRINPFAISREILAANDNVLLLIDKIFRKVPSSFDHYFGDLEKIIHPYFKNHVYQHVMFTYNLLRLGEARPNQRRYMLEFIFKNLISLDFASPRVELDVDDEEDSDNESEDMFAMDIEESKCSPKKSDASVTLHPIGHNLDMVMCVMFRFIHWKMHGGDKEKFHCIVQKQNVPLDVNGCLEGSISLIKGGSVVVSNGCGCGTEKHERLLANELYTDLKFIFSKTLLTTPGTSHVQFLMFYVLGSRPTLVADFLDMLKHEFDHSSSYERRKIALSYLGSFLARGKCVQFSHVHYCLQILYNWCATYLQKQIAVGRVEEVLRSHQSFYCACQTLFYAFTFNYKSYTGTKKDLHHAQSLHLDELITSVLNPLKFCTKTTCENFTSIVNFYQLAYCNTILLKNRKCKMNIASETSTGEHVSHSQDLEMSFPFDPYLLKRSNRFITKHYKVFEGIPGHILHPVTNEPIERDSHRDNVDMEDDTSFWNSPHSLSFSYDMSPHIPCK